MYISTRFKDSNNVLLRVLPQLTNKLQIEDVELRLPFVTLLAKMFSEKVATQFLLIPDVFRKLVKAGMA